MAHTANLENVGTGNFLFVGEHLALDFANTLLAANGEPVETLNTLDDVLDWLVFAHLITDLEKQSLAADLKSSAQASGLLEQLRTLRDSWKINLERLCEEKTISHDFLNRINDLLKPALTRHSLLQEVSARKFHFHSEHVPLEPAKKILAVVAGEMAKFLNSANLKYLRRCAGNDCVVFFYDTTKNHRRQWCSMAICGNRHKVAKFRAKEKNGH